ncbi:unnamed protein product [Miscanthus lutarioriparius]|uniref:Uncharacterized protein n=1 Tax=Miscanthus lutarioriparius TaxID=422564 RepID=A0A811Q7C1_9POAL|nr:unnamed protein product [Miscanthus lutarioriparius]
MATWGAVRLLASRDEGTGVALSGHASFMLDMVSEMETDMDGVLQRFDVDLLLDGHGDGNARGSSDSPCEERCSIAPATISAGRCFVRIAYCSHGCFGGWDNKEAAVGDAMKERIAWALRIYKDAAAGHGGEGGALVQYRTVSLTHAFLVGGGAVPGERGLPGWVFDAGEPEWTPNVQYYGTGEYARISYALIYDIQAVLALPILDPATGSFLAVLELITTSPRLHFAAEVDSLSKALQLLIIPPASQLVFTVHGNAMQAVALRGSEICRRPAPEVRMRMPSHVI